MPIKSNSDLPFAFLSPQQRVRAQQQPRACALTNRMQCNFSQGYTQFHRFIHYEMQADETPSKTQEGLFTVTYHQTKTTFCPLLAHRWGKEPLTLTVGQPQLALVPQVCCPVQFQTQTRPSLAPTTPELWAHHLQFLADALSGDFCLSRGILLS